MKRGDRKANKGEVVSHWSKPYDQFQTPPLEFYSLVEARVRQRAVPQLNSLRVVWREGGLLSANREYLRIEWKEYIYDICAAPFGKGFFFSSWTVIMPPTLSWVHLMGMGISIGLTVIMFTNTYWTYLYVYLIGIVLMAVFLRWNLFDVEPQVEELCAGLTIIAALLDVFRHETTRFEMDTAEMFQGVVHTAVMEAMDEVTQARGVPRLTEFERKPVMRDFFKR